MQIAANTVVSIHYTLTNPAGQELDSSFGREPLPYIHGHNNIIPGLENALEGKSAGERISVTVEPEEGYGPLRDELIQEIDRANFQGVDNVEPGMQFMAQTPWGEQPVKVTKVEGDKVTVDGNHPLAGETLTFDVDIVDVREATKEELEHGHVHGEGGHEH